MVDQQSTKFTPHIPDVPCVIEDTSDEVQFADTLELILIASDVEEKDNPKEHIQIKPEFKSEPFTPRFASSACAPIVPITLSKMSVGHTPTSQAGS